MKRIALVEDDHDIRTLTSLAIKKEGWTAEAYYDGNEALSAFKKDLPDLIILDILLPSISGLDLCKEIRKISEEVPIIFVSSKDEELDRIIGLEIGADDYLCKPFSIKELMIRIRVLFRRLNRKPGNQDSNLVNDQLSLDLDGLIAYYAGENLNLTVTEFKILHTLVKEPGTVKSRDVLLNECYPMDLYINDRAIDNHIRRLRKKILHVDDQFDKIQSVYRLGYRFQKS